MKFVLQVSGALIVFVAGIVMVIFAGSPAVTPSDKFHSCAGFALIGIATWMFPSGGISDAT